MSTLYSTYSYSVPQYAAARQRFEHGGKLLGDYNGRDTNRGLDQLAAAIQNDMSQIKLDMGQIKRNTSPSTTSSRLYLNG